MGMFLTKAEKQAFDNVALLNSHGQPICSLVHDDFLPDLEIFKPSFQTDVVWTDEDISRLSAVIPKWLGIVPRKRTATAIDDLTSFVELLIEAAEDKQLSPIFVFAALDETAKGAGSNPSIQHLIATAIKIKDTLSGYKRTIQAYEYPNEQLRSAIQKLADDQNPGVSYLAKIYGDFWLSDFLSEKCWWKGCFLYWWIDRFEYEEWEYFDGSPNRKGWNWDRWKVEPGRIIREIVEGFAKPFENGWPLMAFEIALLISEAEYRDIEKVASFMEERGFSRQIKPHPNQHSTKTVVTAPPSVWRQMIRELPQSDQRRWLGTLDWLFENGEFGPNVIQERNALFAEMAKTEYRDYL